MTANVVSWHAAVSALAALVLSGTLRLLIERQRQQAFRTMVTGALGDGVLVMEHDGLKERYMRADLRSREPGRLRDGS